MCSVLGLYGAVFPMRMLSYVSVCIVSKSFLNLPPPPHTMPAMRVDHEQYPCAMLSTGAEIETEIEIESTY